MTLRGRLTTAFLVVVLGPVLFGALFAGATAAATGQRHATDRLDLAAATIRTSIGALCRQLRAASGAIATIGEPAGRVGAASQVIREGLAVAVLVTDVAGTPTLLAPDDAPARPWTDCAGPAPDGPPPMQAIAVRTELRDETGTPTGAVWAAELLDDAFLARLAAATGTQVTLLRSTPAAGDAVRSTEPAGARDGVLAAASGLRGDAVAATGDGRYVRRVGPSPGQPLPLVLSVPREPSRTLYALLGVAVLGAGSVAVLGAWRLARSTTRPLAELATVVDRMADGDLAARAPVRTTDEVGRLATVLNHVTRENQSYAQALTSSREQLRGQLAVLGDTLASTHDLHRILRVILRVALAATGARAGVVLLLYPGTATLVGQCAEGLDDGHRSGSPAGSTAAGSAAAGLRIPLGSGLLGTVAATGESRCGRAGDPGLVLHADEPSCRTYMAVPFLAPGHGDDTVAGPAVRPGGVLAPTVLGVLALYDRLGADEFDAADLEHLRTFAGHASVAVQNVRVHEEAQRLSLTDPLTGLWNYRYLKESIRREVERASRFNRMLGVLILDLDRFKAVNDTYGHAAGDAVLVEFAGRVRGEIREVDLAFRQGGEEFVVLLPETDARGVSTVAERLGAAIRDRPILIEPRPGFALPGARSLIPVTVSIGVAVYPDHGATGALVLEAADDALYAAKAAGRDTYRLATATPAGPTLRELPVRAGPGSTADGPPRVGRETDTGPGGASSGPHPPRQSRGG